MRYNVDVHLIEVIEFPKVEPVTRLVRPSWEFVDVKPEDVKPEDVMPDGYGPLWLPLPAEDPTRIEAPNYLKIERETLEFEGTDFYAHRVLDYVPLQPYAVFDVDFWV